MISSVLVVNHSDFKSTLHLRFSEIITYVNLEIYLYVFRYLPIRDQYFVKVLQIGYKRSSWTNILHCSNNIHL